MNSLRKILTWMTKHPFLAGVGVILALALLGTARYLRQRSSGQSLEALRRGDIVESVYGIGTVKANRIYKITPGAAFTVRDIFVREGDHVAKGQSLLRVDTQNYRAPFAGIVTDLPVKVGDNVFAGVPILTLMDAGDRYLLVSLEQQGALHVQAGQSAKISFDTLRQYTYEGRVQAVYSNDNNFLARIDIGDLPEKILPGMTADVAITVQVHHDVLLVPVAALEKGGQIWIRRGRSLPRKVEIKTGIIDEDMAEVISGDLQAGDRPVIREKKP